MTERSSHAASNSAAATNTVSTDICVIGGGSGGLSVAAGAVQMGARVVLCEGHKMGGDCLNYGCVPSKSLIEAARARHTLQHSQAFGLNAPTLTSDFTQIHRHIHQVIDTLFEHDSVERFEGLGVEVIQQYASLHDAHTVVAGNTTIKAGYIVLATGSSPAVPPIPGLDTLPYYTNETIFELQEPPGHLAIIGGGAIGCELACAYRQLGVRVSLIEAAPRILGQLDHDCNELLRHQLASLGIELYEHVTIQGCRHEQNHSTIMLRKDNQDIELTPSHVLVAAGRKPNVDALNLEQAGVTYTPKGVQVDQRLRTNCKNIFAIGDIAGPYPFTHAASYQAGIVIRNILFKLPAKVDYRAFPWAIYTTPEVAHCGMPLSEAAEQGARILRFDYKDNDRAQAGLETPGIIKVAVSRKGRVLGATIVGAQAGELISQWTIAISARLKLSRIAGLVIPYPTLSESNKRVAGSYYTDKLFSSRTRKLVRFLLKWLP